MPRKGYVQSTEHRAKLSNALAGRSLSAEHRQKLAVARRQRPLASQETKDRISANHADVAGKNNPMFGKKGTLSPIAGSKNYRWVHDLSKNAAVLHARVCAKYGKADCCEIPGCSGKSKRYSWSNKKHDYKSDARDEWQKACHSCHQLFDAKHHGSRIPTKL